MMNMIMKAKNMKEKFPPKKELQPETTQSDLKRWIEEILRYPLVKGKSKQFNIRIPWGLYHMIEVEASRQNVSVSDFVRSCLVFYTVPGRLLQMAKQDPKLTLQESKLLEEYRVRLQKLLDDLKLVQYQSSKPRGGLPKPEILDAQWIEQLVELKVNQAIKEIRQAQTPKKEGKPK